jgi:CubicO group peptidase (beta-lactamase class C family)
MTIAAGFKDRLSMLVQRVLAAARIPGSAIAVVANGRIVATAGYGHRALNTKLPVTAQTVYPIASTTKAINATLLGTLIDEGRLEWDAPVQRYLRNFRLQDPLASALATVRDLVTMRTGLPRHDWMRVENPISRADLVERLRYLEPSAGFRERFQYNNLTVTAAGHIAEILTARTWEELVQERIFAPLDMRASRFTAPDAGNATLSYHEDSRRELRLTRRLEMAVTAPAGSVIHSTIEDMARWLLYNLAGSGQPAILDPRTLAEIHSPQTPAGTDPMAPSPNATYALGWFNDTYNGHLRLSHSGYLHDVHSSVTLFPEDDVGIVSFTNFGPPTCARLINEHAFDLLMGLEPVQSIEDKMVQYERKVEDMRQRNAAVLRVPNASLSHPVGAHVGTYMHRAYGELEVQLEGSQLLLKRGQLVLPLCHWHYDAWVVQDTGNFPIHVPHPFDRNSLLLFETDADGKVAALSIQFEPTVPAIRFAKE